MTTPTGTIAVSDVNNELGIGTSHTSSLDFLNGYVKPSIRPAHGDMNSFRGKTYFRNNTEGNCANGNCSSGGNCGNKQCSNCYSVNCVNCTNCDSTSYLQANCNCACTYACNAGACYSYNCNCSKIICTKLYDLGLLPDNIFKADQEYGNWLRDNDPNVYDGYIRWAKTVTECMDGTGPTFFFWIKDKIKRKDEETKSVIKWAKLVATPWAEHMAYLMGVAKSDNVVGKNIMFFGRMFCKLIYMIPERKVEIGFVGTWAIFIICLSSYYASKALAKATNIFSKIKLQAITD